jgi:hypothetical protein
VQIRADREVAIITLQHPALCHHNPKMFDGLPWHLKIDPGVIAAAGIQKTPFQVAAEAMIDRFSGFTTLWIYILFPLCGQKLRCKSCLLRHNSIS